MTSWTLCAVVLGTQLVSVAPQNVQIVPLNDESDPVQVSRGQLAVTDAGAPILMLTLTNRTRETVNTANVWVNFQRFYTWDEMRRNRNNLLFDCGFMGVVSASSPEDVRARPQDVYPGAETTVMLSIPPGCRLDQAHQHFYAYVERITTGGRYSYLVWQRELGNALRTLVATPHQ